MEKCLENSLIVQNILSSISFHPMQYLNIRLVNKRMNREFLYKMRMDNKRISLQYSDHVLEERDGIPELVPYVSLNNHVVTVSQLRKYFEFLVNVIDVKVSEFRMESIWLFQLENYRNLHDNVMHILLKNQTLKVFTGMEDICKTGCSFCEHHAIKCREYGPLQPLFLLGSFKTQKHHFNKLIIWESLFCRVAAHCVQHSSTRDACMALMNSLITPNITCDHLELAVSENPMYSEMVREPIPNQAFPREVLETICRDWKIRTVSITFYPHGKERICSSEWTYKPFFTEFRFNDPSQNTSMSLGLFLNSVELNLEKATYTKRGVFGENGDPKPSCDNLLANVRRLFPAEHYYVNTHQDGIPVSNHSLVLNKKQLEKMLRGIPYYFRNVLSLAPKVVTISEVL